MRRLRYLALAIILFILPATALGKFITSAEEFAGSENVGFSWSDAQSKSLQIFLEYWEPSTGWHRVILGSGFLISPDGVFVTAYHVVKYCLNGEGENSGLSVKVDCSAARPSVRYVAINRGREFPVEVISYLKELESTSGKNEHTPDQIIKQRDFVIAKLKADGARFSYWLIRDFGGRRVDVHNPGADFELTPLRPPKRVFVAGFPRVGEFALSEGFLNLTEYNNRGYFAVDMNVYTEPYLESQGVALDTKWGMRIENHMSGGAVIDSSGYVVGLVVNGNQDTAGVLSIENILATFFTHHSDLGAHPAILLDPTRTPLFLKRKAAEKFESENLLPGLL